MTEEQEERAREEAEARRQKILQSSSDRLGVVTGAGGGENGGDDGEGEEAKKAKTLSKMAQARRRRFKKKDDDSAPPQNEAAADTDLPDAVPSMVKEIKEEPADVPESVPSAPGVAPEPVVPQENESEPVEVTEDVSTVDEQAASTKKKYQGVARVRRQMLKEKQKKSDQDDGGALKAERGSGAGGTDAAASSSLSAAAAAHPTPRTRATWYSTLPIVMHLVTTILLFGAGLDVGMQQSPSPLAVVETQWAPQQEFFALRIVPGLRLLTTNRTKSDAAMDPFLPSADELLKQAEARELVVKDDDDEFAGETLGGGAGKAANEPTIDPLFGVDLDELTQGDSLLMVFARFAVRFHRALLGVVYHGPIRLYSFVMGTLQQLAKSPPLLCLLAITIRQVVGKAILGAKLPAPKSMDDESSKDFLNMIVRGIKGFFLRAFPTVFTLYDIFSHLKNDMYVVLCGLLVGLALRHSVLMPTDGGVSTTGVVIDAVKEEVIPTGTDEL